MEIMEQISSAPSEHCIYKCDGLKILFATKLYPDGVFLILKNLDTGELYFEDWDKTKRVWYGTFKNEKEVMKKLGLSG